MEGTLRALRAGEASMVQPDLPPIGHQLLYFPDAFDFHSSIRLSRLSFRVSLLSRFDFPDVFYFLPLPPAALDKGG